MRHPITALLVLFFISILVLFVAGSQVGEATNPASILLASTPTATLRRGTPPKATPSPRVSQTPTAQPKRVVTKPQAPKSPSSPTSDPWILITSEGFEVCTMPCPGWTVVDRSGDGYDRKWGDSNWFGHQSAWAAWPAAHGIDSIYPPTAYADNMDTRMIYGPFDLSNAQYGYVRFWLWRDIEACCDWIALEASHTGNDNDFQEVARWTGSSAGNWEQVDAWLANYVGDNSVWLAWRFYSDYSFTAQGPWVDDIEIWKYAPSYVTVQGAFYYADRDGQTTPPARFMTAYLYDSNPGGVDELLATTTTNSNGYFQFPPVLNWEANGSNRDLYVVWETAYNDPNNSYVNPTRRMTDFGNNSYRYFSFVYTDAPDGTVDFSSVLPAGFPNLEAMWIFQDLRRGWEFVRNNTSPQSDPGSVTAKWQSGQNSLFPCPGSCFMASVIAPYIFIADQDILSADTVIHELGHQYMFTANGYYVVCNHSIFTVTDRGCAWTEGWADFFPLPVNGDPCYDFRIGPCGRDGGAFFNLEAQGWGDGRPTGDAVEGRVAGALYDLFDNTNDGYDYIGVGFSPIWNIIKTGPQEIMFHDFWDSWKASGNDQIGALLAFYQNTIDYGLHWDYLPVILK